MRQVYDLVEEPRESVYRDLLKFCSGFCDTAILVVREPDWLSPHADQVLRSLELFQEKKVDQSEWPGTRLLEDTASIYYYSVRPQSLDVLMSAVAGLYDWVQPDNPEDLCFLRADGDPLLVTIAHEKDAFLRLTVEESLKIGKVDGLRITRRAS